MGRILVLDPDPNHAGAITWAIRAISCRAVWTTDFRGAVTLIQEQQFDAIVIAAIPGPSWNGLVDAIREQVLQIPQPPHVICLLRGPYCGPNQRVHGARKGFKVVYER